MIVPLKISHIADFLELSAPDKKNHVAIVGGGGKTTILHALGEQLHGRTILTCTTKMGFDQNKFLPIYLKPDHETIGNISIGKPVMVWEEIEGQKAIGVDPSMCDRWFTIVDHVIVEADGSRRLPFKAPAEFEPVIPSSSTLVISTIGADSLDQVISDCCHRPNLVADLAGCMPHDRLTAERASRVILHSEGHKKAKPPDADFCVAITKVDNGNQHKVEVLSNLIRSLDQNAKVMAIAFESAD